MASGLRWTEEQFEAAAYGRRAPRASKSPPAVEIPPPKVTVKPKYRNRKVENEHGKFDSAKEAQRYAELVLLERAGAIAKLRRQVPFALVVNGIHVCDYICDYTYLEGARLVCEDAKGMRTPVFILKKKLMLACHGLEVLET